ncbi:hypothetical protein BV898_15547 [Hypsibius exemplaris]|uniref:Uncharacterized protein n=1 Tax=Hypsibius exemplaris TaxID=2072580 RepID=A0A9X6NBA7_HYPEX|nr:hypothetical protein BV898_15547 [Hypsibius exemplaris]
MKTGCSSRGNWRPLPSQKPWLLMAIAFATVLLLPLLFKFHIQTASAKFHRMLVLCDGEIQRPKVSPTTAPPPRLDRPVTVVTAYYNIPSKHSNAEYLKWIGNFLPRIPCYMYLFTDEKSAEQLIKLRAPFLNRTIFVVRPFAQLKEVKRLEMWKEQHKIDHERHYQSPEVYAWCGTRKCTSFGRLRENAFDSDYFLWTDIGSFRDADRVKHLTTFPTPASPRPSRDEEDLFPPDGKVHRE